MKKVELREGASVVTSDGKDLGKINRFVLDPETNEVTHIVVEKGWLLSEDKVVPFDRIKSATEEKVVLNDNVGSFDDLPSFEETYFVRLDDQSVDYQFANDYPSAQRPAAYYWYPPDGYLGYPAYGLATQTWPRAEVHQNIPMDTVPLKEGANVMSSDNEHVGDVDRLLVEPTSNRATHFVISQGTFLKDRKRVPADWVRTVTEDQVQLHVSSKFLESLPSYETE